MTAVVDTHYFVTTAKKRGLYREDTLVATPLIPPVLILGRRRVDLLARCFDPWPASAPDARLIGSGRLTRTEVAILRLLAAHAPATVPREEILRALWNLAARSSRTLDTHITRLRRKLEDNPAAPHHLMTVYRVGYRLEWTACEPAAPDASDPKPAGSNGSAENGSAASADPSQSPPLNGTASTRFADRPASAYLTRAAPLLPPFDTPFPSQNGHLGHSNSASSSS